MVQDETGTSGVDQLDQAAFPAAGRQRQRRHFNEQRRLGSSAAGRSPGLKPALQNVGINFQRRHDRSETVEPRQLHRRLPEFLWNVLAL